MREQTGIKKVCVSARCAKGVVWMGKAYPFSSFCMACGHVLWHLAVTGQSLDICLEKLEAAVVLLLRERSLWSPSGCLITFAVNAEVSLSSVEVGWILRQGSRQLHCAHENQGSVAF